MINAQGSWVNRRTILIKLVFMLSLAMILFNAAFKQSYATYGNYTAVSGTVTDQDGKPISGLCVSVYNSNTGSWIIDGNTDSNGYYNFNMFVSLSGYYKLQFHSLVLEDGKSYAEEWYNDKPDFNSADPVYLTMGQETQNINAQVEIGGNVLGKVTGIDSLPLEGVSIDIFDFDNYSWAGSTLSSADGSFSFSNLRTGQYKIRFSPFIEQMGPNYLEEWYSDQYNYGSANIITVTGGVMTTGIDAQLEIGGTISGTVTDTNGLAISGLMVWALDKNVDEGVYGVTNDAGDYIINALRPDQYRVIFDSLYFNRTYGTKYAPEWYNGQTQNNIADLVTVIGGQDSPGINGTLEWDDLAPQINNVSPADNSVTSQTTIIVSGVTEPGISVTVNGSSPIKDDYGGFSKQVILSTGNNLVTIVAEDFVGNITTLERNVVLDQLPPALTVTSPANNLITTQGTVIINGSAELGSSLKINGSIVPVSALGKFSKSVTLSYGMNTLTVTATDAAGNITTVTRKVTYTTPNLASLSQGTGIWNLKSNGSALAGSLVWNGTSFPWINTKSVTGDFNGDGKDDIAVMYNYGNSTSGIWLFLSNGTGYTTRLAWKSAAGGFSWEKSKLISGDFNGDGKDDIGVFYNYGANTSGLWAFTSNGTGFSAIKLAWKSAAGTFSWDASTLTSGDYNGDGKTDIAAMYNYGNNTSGLKTFLSNGVGFTAGEMWKSANGGFSSLKSKITSGDTNGDKKDDIIVLYNYGANTTGLWKFVSNGMTFVPSLAWKSGVGYFSWEASKVGASDLNADGKAEPLVMYNYGNNTSGIWSFAIGYTSTTPKLVWKSTGFDWNRANLLTGDFDGDKKGDAQVVYNLAN